MQIQSMHFKARAGAKLADQVLQQNLKTFKGTFVGARAAAVADFNTIGDWEAVRSAGAAIRQRTLQQLDVWIERFEAEATGIATELTWQMGRPIRYAPNEVRGTLERARSCLQTSVPLIPGNIRSSSTISAPDRSNSASAAGPSPTTVASKPSLRSKYARGSARDSSSSTISTLVIDVVLPLCVG